MSFSVVYTQKACPASCGGCDEKSLSKFFHNNLSLGTYTDEGKIVDNIGQLVLACLLSSLKFLLGRLLDNALLNLGLKESFGEGIKNLDFRIKDVLDDEVDTTLGNGGLSRLAAYYIDSLATLAWDTALNILIVSFNKVEFPGYWLNFNNPWELPRLEVVVNIQFSESVSIYTDEEGRK
ncbi:2265_t:CDS:2 [Dentiscutata erythropus]|uniref:Alpha-1,4 glucan phosphorylase n=1 Tax=Dentiscutata erythropus TaxID=1348616 RepID=A0A9N9AKG4_9GLOM|nr:2265_t:CDS:2 [Dentiscutata erythropus]